VLSSQATEWDLKGELGAKGRVTNERTKRYVVRPDGNSRANLTIETRTYGRTNPLGRDALQEAGREKMVDMRTGVTEEGAGEMVHDGPKGDHAEVNGL
jgi:hypothetical protein